MNIDEIVALKLEEYRREYGGNTDFPFTKQTAEDIVDTVMDYYGHFDNKFKRIWKVLTE